jgi:hypothetical protein
MRDLNRIGPALPPEHMTTYALKAPLATHFRPATCAQVDCSNWRHGWRTLIDELTELGQRQAHYIRKQAGRAFTEYPDGGITVFEFEPGQECFAQHQRPLEREPLYLVRGGDWRGDPRGTGARVHASGEDWVEDMQTSLDKTRTRAERG